MPSFLSNCEALPLNDRFLVMITVLGYKLFFQRERDTSVQGMGVHSWFPAFLASLVVLGIPAGMTPATAQTTPLPAAEIIALPPAPTSPAPAPLPPADLSTLCAMEVARQERLLGIPERLLHAISLAESGRYDPSVKAVRAWPWTVMAEGQGRYLATKQEAIAEVRALQAKGVRNIDVGCMQVNLRHHPDAFSSLEEAFDPATNVAYSARFLSSLYDNTNNWTLAASYYHSQTPHLAAAYRERLVQIWEREKGAGSQFDDLPQNNFFLAAGQPPSSTRLPSGKSPEALAKLERSEAERQEAKRIADAYREARIKEYQYKKAERLAARTGASFLPTGKEPPSAPPSQTAPASPPSPPVTIETPPVQPKLPPAPR